MSQIKNKEELEKALEKGYREMADINSELADEGVASDNEALEACVGKLLECD